MWVSKKNLDKLHRDLRYYRTSLAAAQQRLKTTQLNLAIAMDFLDPGWREKEDMEEWWA